MPGDWQRPEDRRTREHPDQRAHPIDGVYQQPGPVRMSVVLQFHDGSVYEYRNADGSPEGFSDALIANAPHAGDPFNHGMRWNSDVEYRRALLADVTGWVYTKVGPEP